MMSSLKLTTAYCFILITFKKIKKYRFFFLWLIRKRLILFLKTHNQNQFHSCLYHIFFTCVYTLNNILHQKIVHNQNYSHHFLPIFKPINIYPNLPLYLKHESAKLWPQQFGAQVDTQCEIGPRALRTQLEGRWCSFIGHRWSWVDIFYQHNVQSPSHQVVQGEFEVV